MSDSKTIDCVDGTIEISECGDAITLRSASIPRMPTTIRLSASERQQLVNLLLTSDDHDGWSVWRQGDDGNAFMMASGLTQANADAMVQDFELNKHKQLYWASQCVREETAASV